MLYKILKIPASVALYFYCRHLRINNKEFLKQKGPLLIAANHPNSFLDAIILASIFKFPIYSLARGDAFKNSFFRKVLQSLKMLPVYRVSEGAENLEHNYTTFSACIEIFKKNGIVLIFSEGRCINEWHLRPLKKGTARLALDAWRQGIPLRVLPLGINYSSFKKFGKNIILNFGEIIYKEDIDTSISHGNSIANFNTALEKQLRELVYECDINDEQKAKKLFEIPQSLLKKILLFIPACLGWLFHFPLYIPIARAIKNKAHDHYDSIVVGLLFVLYPIYLLLISFLCYMFFGVNYALAVFIVLPFCAWSYLQLKK